MFAVIKTGGKQYRVAEGDVISIEKLEAEEGAKTKFSEILMLNNGGKIIIKADELKNASVEAEVIEQYRDKKVIIFKKKRRKNHRRKMGHRQFLTLVKITKISA